MNGFNLSEASDIKLGSSTITALYLGSSKLWPLGHDYSQDYFTIESLDDNNTISWFLANANYGTKKTIAWSTDKTNWTSVSSYWTSSGRTITTLNTGDKIYLKGTNTQLANGSAWCNFNSTGNYIVYGNIMSLLYDNNFTNKIEFSNSVRYIFQGLFNGSNVVDASNLILPATTAVYGCYSEMFKGCKSLTNAPELPVTTLAERCYYNMFYGCTSLSYIKCLATDISASSSHDNWVYNVAATGTFVKPSSMTSWTSGTSGIPSGWTIVNI